MTNDKQQLAIDIAKAGRNDVDSGPHQGPSLHLVPSTVEIPPFQGHACPRFILFTDAIFGSEGDQLINQPHLFLLLVLAAASIANIVKSSLGPVGLDKMIVNEIGVSAFIFYLHLRDASGIF